MTAGAAVASTRAGVTFSTQQLLACVPGLPFNRFAQWVNRKIVVLPARVRKGTGTPRAYLPEDVAQVAVIHELTGHGFPPRDARLIWLTVVAPRLLALSTQDPGERPLQAALIVRDPGTGELVCRIVTEGEVPAETGTMATLTLFRLDYFLGLVAVRLQAVQAGEPPPDEPGPLRGADPDPGRYFDTDADGQQTLVGLTAAESRELLRLNQPGGTGEPGGAGLTDEELDAEEARREQLQGRHNDARLRRLHAEAKAAKGET